ncbi:Magnetosome protein MamN [Rhodospirillaceae bacterium LM-1]|nr:Magnetosome protein MamN [Rhodospirillaceae bacterium LM-1]
MAGILSVLVFIAVFAAMFREVVAGHVAVLAGAAAFLLIGSLSGGYTPQMAINSIYFETLALIFGMSAMSALIAKSGLFVHLAEGMAEHSLGNGWWVLVMMSLVTYAIALVTNNIATMVIILPITLNICRRVELNPVPLIIVEIVAANLGGASTMIGDFPNMIIASAGVLHFNDFISGMMVPCLVLLALTLVFFEYRLPNWRSKPKPIISRADDSDHIFGHPIIDQNLLRKGLFIFGLALAGFVLAGTIDVRPGWIAFVAGLAALVFGGFKEDDIFQACGGHDILFFVGLFVMVGGLTAVGVLDWCVFAIDWLGGSSTVFRTLVFLWLVAGLTAFIGGSTSAALFAPIAASLVTATDPQTAWWALSLGILAGSSGALSGATAGSLAVSHYERFIKRHPEILKMIPAGQGLGHREYARWGMPIMVLFLCFSTLYIVSALN